jgi:hypothetical protein
VHKSKARAPAPWHSERGRRKEEGRERAETVNRAHIKPIISENVESSAVGGTVGGTEEAHETEPSTSPAALRRKKRLKARAIIEVAT